MDKETALGVFEDLDKQLAWSQEEYEQGVREAEAEDEEPMDNPHVFSVRLDGSDDRNATRDYRIRATFGEWGTPWSSLRALVDLAQSHDLSLQIQNNGIELS